MSVYNELNSVPVGEQLRAAQTGEPTTQELQEQQDIKKAAAAGSSSLGPAAQALRQSAMRRATRARSEDLTQEAILDDYGDSRYDYRNPYNPEADQEDIRAAEQPAFWKIANGALRGGVTAFTTAANTIGGTAAGLFEGILEFGKEATDKKKQDFGQMLKNSFEAGITNDVSQFFTNVRNYGQELFPEYRTAAERNDPWWKHFGSPNQIGEFLDNFGFTVGAMGAGSVTTKVLGKAMSRKLAGDLMKGVAVAAEGDAAANKALTTALKNLGAGTATTVDANTIINNIHGAAKALNKMQTKLQLAGGVLSAFGEGSFEGLNARSEFLDSYLNTIEKEYHDTLYSLESNLMNNPNYVDEYDIYDNFGNYVRTDKQLNEAGKNKLFQLRYDASTRYANLRKVAFDEADDLAAVVFALNIPVLTGSNTYQFGKMLSGGWKTARDNVVKTAGKLSWENGALKSSLTGVGQTGGRAVGRAVKVGLSEFGEEMTQGVISSGAKNVADTRMTAFHDRTYDAPVLKTFAGWFDSMLGGAKDYLGDPENLNEGVMGLITGLLGVPSITRNSANGKVKASWEGGIPGAVREARETVAKSEEYAHKLNEVINSPDFKERWKGWVRHNSLEREMSDAVSNDDPYAWHGANNAQLINDIILFAKTGKLNDLEEVVNRYANINENDIDDIKENLYISNNDKANVDINSMSPSAIAERIKKQANNVKESINIYRDTYDALYSIMPQGTSDEQIEEMLFTSMQLRNYENRFFTLLGEVLDGLAPVIEKETREANPKESAENIRNEVEKAQAIYTKLYAANPIPTKLDPIAGIRKQTMDALEKAAEGNDELKTKIHDMNRLAEDRRNFYKKLRGLREMSSEEFAKEAVTPEEATQEVNNAKAVEETKDLNSLDDVKREYFSRTAKDKGAFIDSLAAVADSNPHANNFLKIKKRFDDFKTYVYNNSIELDTSKGVTPPMLQSTINSLLARARSEEELINLPDNMFIPRDKFEADFQSPFGPTNPAAYDAVKKAVRDAMAAFLGADAATASRKTISPTPVETPETPGTVDTPTGRDAAQPASVEQAPAQSSSPWWAQPSEPEAKESEKQVEEPEEEKEEQSEEIELGKEPTTEEIIEDAGAVSENSEAEAVENDVVPVPGEKNKISYYRTSIPEIATGEAKKARDAIKNKDWDTFKTADLRDYGEVNKNYSTLWNALNDKYAFENVASVVEKGDEIEFVIDPTFPKYNNEEQILMTVNKNGKRNVLTILSGQTSQYYGLKELRNTIKEEYKKFANEHPNDLFVFSKKSKVWMKQAGLIDYGPQKEDKPVQDVRAYKEDAPIVFINRVGEAEAIRGDKNSVNQVSDNFNDVGYNTGDRDGIERRGNLYYLVEVNNPVPKNSSVKRKYAPIRLNVEHFNQDNKNSVNDTFNAIRDILTEMADIVARSNETNIEEQNQLLSAQSKELGKYLDIHKDFFKIGNFENVGVALRYSSAEEPGKMRTPSQMSASWMIDFVASLSRPVQLKQNAEGEIENLDDLIKQGLITTNARMLRPKGSDFYIYPWIPSKNEFGPVTKVQEEEEQQIVEEASEEREESVPTISDDEGFGDRDDFDFDDIEDETPSNIDKANAQAEEAQKKLLGRYDAGIVQELVGKSIKEYTDDIHKALNDKGWSDEEWDKQPPLIKEKELKCL